MLTRGQKRKYVQGGGVRCPYCQSQELEAGQGEFDADFAWVTVTCTDCGEEWHEVFHLATINPLDEQGRPMLDDDEEEGVGLEVQ
jgi:ssDNA-binding Zn-finger/Zn-ribbon topoisomerase 1